MYATIRRYEGVKDPAGTGRRVGESFVPLLRGIIGFVAYYWVDAGGGVVITTSVFESRSGAEASDKKAAEWARANLASALPKPPAITKGEVLASSLARETAATG